MHEVKSYHLDCMWYRMILEDYGFAVVIFAGFMDAKYEGFGDGVCAII